MSEDNNGFQPVTSFDDIDEGDILMFRGTKFKDLFVCKENLNAMDLFNLRIDNSKCGFGRVRATPYQHVVIVELPQLVKMTAGDNDEITFRVTSQIADQWI